MTQIFEYAIRQRTTLQNGAAFRTPDNQVGVNYSIRDISNQVVEITLNSGNTLSIRERAFSEAMSYLIFYHHGAAHPALIGSNNNAQSSGPLCSATRLQNKNVRCINYIVPILQDFGFVDFSGNRPNTCWYV